jgi:hypothetical protein
MTSTNPDLAIRNFLIPRDSPEVEWTARALASQQEDGVQETTITGSAVFPTKTIVSPMSMHCITAQF